MDIYELYQDDKLLFKGTKQELAEKTGLSLSTINNYCRPGYLESVKNETNTKIIKSNMKEIDVQNSIRLALNPYAVVFRANVGKVRMSDGRFFDTGLPKGFSDLFGFRKSDGKIFFIEVKNATGRLRKEQEHFISMMRKHGAIAGVARSAEEAIKLIEGDLCETS